MTRTRIIALASLASLSLGLALSSGCDCAGPTRLDDAGPGDAHLDTSPHDARTVDVGSDATHDAGAMSCASDLDCPAGQLCLGHFCQPDPWASGSPCAATERCRAVCVA